VTEAEWMAGVDPAPLWEFISRKVGQRKLRLFACACCRRIWHLFADQRSRWAVEVGERLADGLTEEQEAKAAYFGADAALAESKEVVKAVTAAAADQVLLPGDALSFYCLAWYYSALALEAERLVAEGAGPDALERWSEEKTETDWTTPGWVEPEASASICQALREIVGNPFRPVSVNPVWLTPGVVELARTMYEGRGFERMPELANALERTGCAKTDILAHCRQQGEHGRGCWVVDLQLDRE
jgi:hypothetical protein